MATVWVWSHIALWGFGLVQAFLIFVLFRQFGVMYLGTAEGVSRDGVALGKLAPVLNFTTIDGKKIGSRDLQGGLTLLVFGSSQCGPCHKLVPDLNQLARSRSKSLSAIFVSHGSEEENRAFAMEFDPKVSFVSEASRSLMEEKFKVRVTPFAFVLDGEGVIRSKGIANHKAHLNNLLRMAESGPGGANESISPTGERVLSE